MNESERQRLKIDLTLLATFLSSLFSLRNEREDEPFLGKNNLFLQGIWLANALKELSFENTTQTTFEALGKSFEAHCHFDFILFWNSKNMQKLRGAGLLVL